ncbi:MAG: cobalt-precorrin-8X methylmutase [Moorea sp. SIO2B7]|nr:cobalt-precorrin-8X methylmutase [Moorena sp. SIO2B7]
MSQLNHPILEKSFAIIDQEMGEHNFSPSEYAIIRRVIHSTADFEFAELLRFSPGAIESGIVSLRRLTPIITDVGMVRKGVSTLVKKTFNNPLITAVELISEAMPGKTRTETGLLQCFEQYPHGIYVIGNAPTALLSLCEQLSNSDVKPGLIIGAPVGFVSVVESKQALAKTSVPHIVVKERKGGSSVAAAILNALLVLAW